MKTMVENIAAPEAVARGTTTVVLKYGGSVQENAASAAAWARDVALVVARGMRPIVVHGGGPELSHWMQRLGLEPRFVDGHRVTDELTAELAEMVFAGRVNKQIVTLLLGSGVRALGLSGSDAGMLRIRRHQPGGADIGFVGAIDAVDPSALLHLLDGGYVPVVAPTATDDSGQTHNINADLVAAAVAAAVGASELVFMSDVPGYVDAGSCVPVLDVQRAQSLLETGRVTGGMRPKLEAALQALRSGVQRVRLVDGRSPHVLVEALCVQSNPGTLVVADAASAATLQPIIPAWSGTLAARGAAALMDTYAREPIELTSGSGCRVFDSQGRSYLDFGAGIAVNALGHGHPALGRALRNAACGMLHTSNLYWTEPMVRLAERLVDVTGMQRAFFCNSGTEAVEAAIKMGRKARPGRSRIVVFEGAFHGRTLGALSATMQESYQEPFRPLLAGFTALPFGDFDAASARIDNDTALVLVEPIQGEGGVLPAPPGFLAHLRALCDRSGALLVCDEVQTGVGRTGSFLACQAEGVSPDAVTLAKALAGGLPLGVLLARDAAASAFGRGDHGSTFGGGPAVAAMAHAVLDVVLEPEFTSHVRARGVQLGRALRALAAEHPRQVATVRGRGLMWGVLLHSPQAPELVAALREVGLLALQAGKKVLRLLPPLVIEAHEIESGCALLQRGLTQLAVGRGESGVP